MTFSHDGSRLTHGHVRSQVCCAVYGFLVRHLLTVKDRSTAWDAAVSSADQIYAEEARFGKPYQDELRRITEFSNCQGSGYVIDCLRSAWDAVHDAEDYVDAVCRAVRFGNDTDTTAAVAGGLAGLVFGLDSIPDDWREQLRLEDEQSRLIQRFVDAVSESLSASD